MAIIFSPCRGKPDWKLTWTDFWTHRKRNQRFETREEAEKFEEARLKLAAYEKDLLRRAKSRAKSRAGRVTPCTLNELADAFLSSPHLRPQTGTSHRHHLHSFLALFGQRQAKTITPEDLDAYIEIEGRRGVAPSTIYRRVTILRAALNWGVRHHRLARHPLPTMPLKRPRSRRIDPPTIRELNAMLPHAAPHVMRLILLGLYSGARVGPSELLRISWLNVDLENGVMRIPCAAKREGVTARDVPIRKELVPLLRAWRKLDSLLYPHCRYVIHYRGACVSRVNQAWRSARHAAGITRAICPRHLRQAFATYSLARGADISSVATIMDHTDHNMILNVYQHIRFFQLRDAVQKVYSLNFSAARERTEKELALARDRTEGACARAG